jgi:cytochrome b
VTQRVWDLPTRIFHWVLVALIAFSWWSAEYDHLDWHVISGEAILCLLAFRLLWGLFGSSTARFSAFVHGPKSIFAYLRGNRGWSEIGHNPLGGLSVLALLIVTSVQVGLGLFAVDEDGFITGPLSHFVSTQTSDAVRELHESNFDILLALIALHVTAIVFYRVFRGKRLLRAMITGHALIDAASQPMRQAKWWTALVCIAAALAFTRWIVAGAPPFGT